MESYCIMCASFTSCLIHCILYDYIMQYDATIHHIEGVRVVLCDYVFTYKVKKTIES